MLALQTSRGLRRMREGIGRLGDNSTSDWSLFMGSTPVASTLLPNLFNTATPNTTFEDWWSNLLTGNLTQNQVSYLQSQEAQSLVQAGAPQPQAQAQSAIDATDTLNTFTAPGAFDVTSQGALPQSASIAGLPLWLWVVGGIGAALLVLKK